MSKPIEEMSLEEIQAEREEIQRQREELEAAKAERNARNGLQPETVVELPEPGYVTPGPEVYDAMPTAPSELAIVPDPFADPEPEEADEDDAPEPWPHEHLVHLGLELDVRIPSQSALMAISMLQQLDGLGELQMDIFNTFLANHLSTDSLAKVIKEFTRPETEMTMQGLVQALVNLRVQQA